MQQAAQPRKRGSITGSGERCLFFLLSKPALIHHITFSTKNAQNCEIGVKAVSADLVHTKKVYEGALTT